MWSPLGSYSESSTVKVNTEQPTVNNRHLLLTNVTLLFKQLKSMKSYTEIKIGQPKSLLFKKTNQKIGINLTNKNLIACQLYLIL